MTRWDGLLFSIFLVRKILIANCCDYIAVRLYLVTGIVSVGWWFLWIYLVYDTPDSHPRISKEERQYIEKSLVSTKVRCSERKTHAPTIWCLSL